MRYVTFVARPTEGYFHPVDRALLEDPDVTPEAVHHVELLSDGTIAMVARVSGDPNRYREILAESEAVLDFAVSATSDEGIGYSRIVPNDRTVALFEHQRATEFVVEMPVEYTGDGGQRYTIVGSGDHVFGDGLEPPEGVDVTVESVGTYRPNVATVFASLTTRERDVLRTAIDLGYYENPREATQTDLARELDISPSAVGKHLRNIEASVFSSDRLP
ncbi:helix-turn-helix domain-containing protein [Halobacteria archaeon AArc-m2/3/4]|uniref:Helix-turn-helix domain-containing protein n=1 Tax=Natronoglomus mannanivorans TaxID=2979990 RepID=A0AAP2YZP1_9EURY|nr:helix-turn-helix domain-containing protein [Halobacteria archaeon AArc-xg1-1]MCU4971246.1 helix-turn-helix domain-containing protein [Halobacteria archaeon AArc-m2/3/4]